MLRNLLSNRLFIGALAFFILCVGGSLLYQQRVKQQTARDLARVQEKVKQFNERQKTQKQAPVGDTTQGGHFHADGTWHAEPHAETRLAKGQNPTPPSQLPLGSSGEKVLTKEEEAERLKYWADMGLEPPPPGYNYQWDENGNVTLYQYNVPEFKVKWSEEIPGQDYFKLTDEEWRRFRALQHIVSQTPLRLTQEHEKILRAGGPFPKVTYAPGVVELAKEKLAELDRKASGRTPRVSIDITWNRHATPEDLADIRRQAFERLQSLENEKPERPPPGPWDETFIDALVKELEAEIQRR